VYNPPSIISSIHKKAIRISEFLEYFKNITDKDEIILFKDFWWYNRMDYSKEFETELMEHYNFKLILADPATSYAFYNLTRKKPIK
jgi:hypothetical protein